MDVSMIYINGSFLTQPMTGVERYAYNICKAMVALQQPFTIVCPKAPIHQNYDVSDLHIVHYGIGNSHFWEQCILPLFFIGKKDYIVFSFTGLGSILIHNKVMTIHDLSFLENPKWFSKGYYWWYKLMTPLAARTSRHIITVSEFSKKEIFRFYSFIKEQNISVVYNAADRTIFHHLPQSSVPAEPFFLAVSSLDPRKNFTRLIEAFKDVKDCNLYIVGSHYRVFTQQDSTTISQNNIKFLGRVSDEDLVRLYNQAVGFIFPSIYEGFGLPPIEAMNCGCPVLVSDIPVMREVCGKGAIYFNPYDKESIRNTIEKFLNFGNNDKEQLRAFGHENTQRFTWENSAKHIISLINKLSMQ